jgi:hypothetical protein
MLRSVSRSVPIPACVTGNGGVRSQGQTSKVRSSHQNNPDKGKTGRMNTREPLTRLRCYRSPERWLIQTAMMGQGRTPTFSSASDWGPHCSSIRTPRPRSIEGILPSRISPVRNVATPMESDDGRCVSKPIVRTAQYSSGTGRPKKRIPAAERQQEFITGWIGQYPPRKGADVGLVNRPKNDVRATNQRKS